MQTTFDPTKHPRDRFGQFRDKVGDASTQIVDALLQHDDRLASDPTLQKRMYENYRGILDGNLLTEGKAVDAVVAAGQANAKNSRFSAAQERFGVDSIVVIKPGAEGFASGALAERRAATSFVQDHSSNPLDWPAKAEGQITPGDINSTDGLDGVLRHEYGHTVWEALSVDDQNVFRAALPDDYKTTRDALSVYAGYSQRMGKPNEPFCELFSVVTHRSYDRSQLHPDLQAAAEVVERIVYR